MLKFIITLIYKEMYMKEQLYTIPLNDAFTANDECPFCYIEQQLEHDLLDFTLGSGSSYMESDIREQTDNAGFCRTHFQKMFQYGNTLGNAWILKTHYRKINDEFSEQVKKFKPVKLSLMDKLKRSKDINNSMTAWTYAKQQSCYICSMYEKESARYLDTFFYMYKKDSAFKDKITGSKGFCLVHFGDLCQEAVEKLSDKQRDEFFSLVFPLMEDNLKRIGEDVSWMVEKFDYRNADADWKNSKDSIQRGMQKLKGGYPAAPVYQQRK
jgi:hypothetical protein